MRDEASAAANGQIAHPLGEPGRPAFRQNRGGSVGRGGG